MTSDFDRMKLERLPNWGRWGRQDSDRPDPEAGTGSIYQLGRADRQGAQTVENQDGELVEEATDDPPPRIDQRDAEALDKLIIRLAGEHRFVICGHFYKRKEQFRHKVDGAVRALLDAEYAQERKRA